MFNNASYEGFVTPKKARARLLKLFGEDALKYMDGAHEEVRAGRVFHLKGVPTVRRLVALARSKGLLKRRSG